MLLKAAMPLIHLLSVNMNWKIMTMVELNAKSAVTPENIKNISGVNTITLIMCTIGFRVRLKAAMPLNMVENIFLQAAYAPFATIKNRILPITGAIGNTMLKDIGSAVWMKAAECMPMSGITTW